MSETAISEIKVKTELNPRQLYKRKQVARILNVTDKTVQNWGKSGKLTPIVLGYNVVRYDPAEIDRLVK